MNDSPFRNPKDVIKITWICEKCNSTFILPKELIPNIKKIHKEVCGKY